MRALSLCTCRRHYPGAADGRTRRSNLPIRVSLPRNHYRVGLHTRAVTKTVTVIRRLQTFRLLHACSGCFRLERSPGGACTRWKSAALSRRTWIADLRQSSCERLGRAEIRPIRRGQRGPIFDFGGIRAVKRAGVARPAPPSPASAQRAFGRADGQIRLGCWDQASPSSSAEVPQPGRSMGPSPVLLKVPITSLTVASDHIGQCETRGKRRHRKNALASPEEPSASRLPSPAAVLRADSTTQSALSFRAAILDALKRPSSSGVASEGGVSTDAGSVGPFSSLGVNP